MMVLTIEDRLELHELISLHGHVMDRGEFDRLHELFTPDAVYDLEDFGLGQLQGIEAIEQAALALGERNPLGHHTTNIVIGQVDEDGVHVLSKGIAIQADGSSGTVSYDDRVRRTAEGWRIARRKVVARRTPLHP